MAEKARKLVARDVEPGLKAEIYRIAGLSRFKLEEDETGRHELEKYLELKRNGIVLEFQGTLKKTGKDDNIDNTQI